MTLWYDYDEAAALTGQGVEEADDVARTDGAAVQAQEPTHAAPTRAYQHHPDPRQRLPVVQGLVQDGRPAARGRSAAVSWTETTSSPLLAARQPPQVDGSRGGGGKRT